MNWNPPMEDPGEWREPAARTLGPLEAYKAWCLAHRADDTAHDNLAAWVKQLCLPRYVRVQWADHVARAMFGERAPELLAALEIAGCFGP